MTENAGFGDTRLHLVNLAVTSVNRPHGPMDALLRILANPWKLMLLGYVWHVLRYVLMAGSAYLVFYVLFRRQWLRRKIQAVFPPFSQMRREVLYSLLSFVMFALTGLLTLVLYRLGWSQLYFDIPSRGWAYFWFSALALIVLHDAWFYWTHRLMHWRPLFPIVHRVHHLSHNPTPWASFAFHPIEALVQAIYFPLIATLLPTHPLAAGLWLLYMTFMNVAGHLGYEFLPRGFASHRVFRWHNTPLHHNMHHSRVHCNYGLYFNVWDRLMGTNHPQYEEEYERCTRRVVAEFAKNSGVAMKRACVPPPEFLANSATCTQAEG